MSDKKRGPVLLLSWSALAELISENKLKTKLGDAVVILRIKKYDTDPDGVDDVRDALEEAFDEEDDDDDVEDPDDFEDDEDIDDDDEEIDVDDDDEEIDVEDARD